LLFSAIVVRLADRKSEHHRKKLGRYKFQNGEGRK
jgi:hypothetical protein